MRTRYAATALLALALAVACGIAATGLVSGQSDQTALLTSTWSVQASTDYGTSWEDPALPQGTTLLPLRIDTTALRARAAYQPVSLRTSAGSLRAADVRLGTPVAVDATPDVGRGVRVRATVTSVGTCAATSFESGDVNLIVTDPSTPAPLGTRTADHPLSLEGATTTTAGSTATLCLEFSVDPAAAQTGAVTVAFPLTIAPQGTSDRG